MNNKKLLKEIKKANKLSVLTFNYLHKLHDKKLNKTIYRLTEINEILSYIEIDLEMKLESDINE